MVFKIFKPDHKKWGIPYWWKDLSSSKKRKYLRDYDKMGKYFMEQDDHERSKREDSWIKNACIDKLFDDNGNLISEMRCSEHDSNAVREVQ